MTDAWKALKLEQFESVTAGPSTALLRVRGKPSRRRDEQRRPALRVRHTQSIRRYAPIPAPPDPRGVLRVAYSVPLAMLGPETTFWLEHDDGSLAELPAPTSGLIPASAVPSGSGPAERPAPSERPGAKSGAESDRTRQLAAELAEARERAELAEAANQRLTATLDELEIWRAELERRLAATTTALGAAEAELELRDPVGGPSGGPTS